MKNNAADVCWRFYFSADMNLDGAFTISDFGLLIQQVVLIPASVLMYVIERFPPVLAFFEADCGTGRGVGGWIFSGFMWFALIGGIAGELGKRDR